MVRLFPTLAVMLCISAGAAGDIMVGYGVDGDDPSTPELEVQPGVNPLTIGLSSTEPGFEAFGIMFSFEDAAIPELTLSNFVWDDVFDPGKWFGDPSLPEPVIVDKSPVGLPVPLVPDLIEIASVDVNIEPVPFGTLLTLPTGPTIFDPATGMETPLTPGSDSIVLRVVPEPSAVALMAFGLAFLRRLRACR